MIRANPDDDAARLVFADWLDENEPDKKVKKGAPPSAWAALIRAECELTRLRNDGSAAAAVFNSCDPSVLCAVRWERAFPEMCRYVELSYSVNELRLKASRAVRAALPKAGKSGIKWAESGWDNETDRGFIGSATIRHWRKFVAALPTLTASCPRVELDFADNIGPEDAKEAVDRGFARWCRTLNLDLDGAETAQLICEMSKAPETTGVRGLRLTCDDEDTSRALGTIADSPNWSGLRELALSSVCDDLPKPLVGRLFRAPHLRGLTRVSIEGETTLPAVDAIIKLPELQELGCDFGNLDDATARRIADNRGLTKLRTLRARCSPLTGVGLTALLTSPNLRDLAVLFVNLSDLRNVPVKALAKAPGGRLRVLDCSRCQLNDTAVAIATSPRFSDVVCFNAGTELDSTSASKLLSVFGDRPPAALTMHDAKLSADDVRALANWPGAARLDFLDLWCVNIKANAAKVLAKSPHLQNLRHFHYTPFTAPVEQIVKAAFGDRAHWDVLY
jgi:uncharacterized protein (TIGR02996 family)